MSKHRAPYQGHALDEITLDGTFKEARGAAAMATATGTIQVTFDDVTVNRIDRGPAFRVKDLPVVIVLAGMPGRYKSHAA